MEVVEHAGVEGEHGEYELVRVDAPRGSTGLEADCEALHDASLGWRRVVVIVASLT